MVCIFSNLWSFRQIHCSYAILAWSHMTLFYFGFPGHLLNLTVMEGMIWYVLPMTLITLNDITAYYVGFFFGKTPLIKVQHVKMLLTA